MPFSDVRGHGDVIARLRKSVESGRVASSYLFAGPDGIGKSLLIRRFLAALYCRKATGADSCGVCPDCTRIATDHHPDVIRVLPEEDKKLIGIPVLRDVQMRLALKPLEGEWKAAFVEDARLLTPEAQNSFLRTLEEPPGRCVLCLAAPTARTLLPTIVSRCQVINCRPLEDDECRAVVEAELSTMEDPPSPSPEELGIVIRLAEGSPGATLRLLASPVISRRHELIEQLIAIETQSRGPADRLGRIVAASEELTKSKEAPPLPDLLWLYGSYARDLLHAAWGRALDHSDLSAHIQGMAARIGPAACLDRLDALDRARRALEARNLNARLTVETLLLALTGGGASDAPTA